MTSLSQGGSDGRMDKVAKDENQYAEHSSAVWWDCQPQIHKVFSHTDRWNTDEDTRTAE